MGAGRSTVRRPAPDRAGALPGAARPLPPRGPRATAPADIRRVGRGRRSGAGAAALTAALQRNVAQVIVGLEAPIELLLVALLCEGHVLIDDVPGTGKTTLAKTLARSLDCHFQRIQFTPDLLPSDITGSSV